MCVVDRTARSSTTPRNSTCPPDARRHQRPRRHRRPLADAGADRTIQGAGAPGFAGKTALEIAEAGGRVIMTALLRDAGANPRT
jgi:hypothetical protein